MPFLHIHTVCPICRTCLHCLISEPELPPLCSREYDGEKHTHEVRAAKDINKWFYILEKAE